MRSGRPWFVTASLSPLDEDHGPSCCRAISRAMTYIILSPGIGGACVGEERATQTARRGEVMGAGH